MIRTIVKGACGAMLLLAGWTTAAAAATVDLHITFTGTIDDISGFGGLGLGVGDTIKGEIDFLNAQTAPSSTFPTPDQTWTDYTLPAGDWRVRNPVTGMSYSAGGVPDNTFEYNWAPPIPISVATLTMQWSTLADSPKLVFEFGDNNGATPLASLNDIASLPFSYQMIYLTWSGGQTLDIAVTSLEYRLVATPVPAALPLLATALGGLGFVGWRRRKAAQGAAA